MPGIFGWWRASSLLSEVPNDPDCENALLGGDKVIVEWDKDEISPDRLTEIETEFREKMAAGFFAVDIHEKRNR